MTAALDRLGGSSERTRASAVDSRETLAREIDLIDQVLKQLSDARSGIEQTVEGSAQNIALTDRALHQLGDPTTYDLPATG